MTGRARGVGRTATRAVLIVGLAAALAGCVTVNRVSFEPTATPVPPAAPTPPPTVTPAPSTSIAPGPTSGPVVVVDPALLAHVPTSVFGFEIKPDPVTAANVARDPTLAANAAALAMAIVAAPGGANGDDLAVVSVVKLRPGVDNPIFRVLWRQAYDQVACEQAGGTAGSKDGSIKGRDVVIGTCKGGATTYHTSLADGLLVSITSLGPRGFGEQIVADLQE